MSDKEKKDILDFGILQGMRVMMLAYAFLELDEDMQNALMTILRGSEKGKKD